MQKNSQHKPTIHVVGDSMIDEFYNVKVTRISPESPNICVMLSSTDQPDEVLPGGAANICYQLKNFNVNSKLFSWKDQYASSVFEEADLIFDGIMLRDFSGSLPVKKRFFDGDTQVGYRWDVETPNCGVLQSALSDYQLGLFNIWLEAHVPDVMILSDYNKGIFSTTAVPYLNCTSNSLGIPTIVDPKKGPLCKWKGCTIFKPNSVEAQELSGLSDWRAQCEFFQKELGCRAVVITQQGTGVVGKEEMDYFEYSPPNRVKANKISGAGDCFVGVLALAISHKMSIKDAAIVAFEAGALFVQQHSRSPITPWQLQKKSKYVTPQDLYKRDFTLVFTNGCFDILHSGHLESLRFAKTKGDKLVVAVNSDASVSRLKGQKRPVVPLAERMEILAALECVDYVISFENDSPLELVRYIKPDVLIKGADWKDKPVAGTEYAGEVCFVPLVKDKSTTNIIEKIKTLV